MLNASVIVQTVAMCSAAFCIVYRFVVFVVDTICDHMVEAYYGIGFVC